MEIVSKKLDDANAVVTATITKERLEKAESKIAKNIAKNAKIDGFRKGKVPMALVKKRYGDQLVQDARQEVLQEIVAEGAKQLGEGETLGQPAITKFDEKEGEIDVEAKFSLKPPFDLGDYMGMVPAFDLPEVSDEEVEKTMKDAAAATAVPVKIEEERPLADGDFAVFDFEGTIDGEPIEGGAGKNFNLQIGSGRFIPGFEEQMKGMKVGENKTLTVTFPEEYQASHLAGKEAKFDVILNEIQAKPEVALDDEVAKKMLPNDEEANLEKFRKVVKDSLLSEKTTGIYNTELKPKLLEILVKGYDFPLPELVVDAEVNNMLREKLTGLDEGEMKRYQANPSMVDDLRNEVKTEAQDRVKATLIVDALAQKEGISVTDQELSTAIYYEAMQQGQDPKQVIEMYQQQGLMPVIKMSMIEDKLLSHLLTKKNPQNSEA